MLDPTHAAFSEVLLTKGLVSKDALARGQEIAEASQIRLPFALARLGLLSESEIADVLADLHGVRKVGRASLHSAIDVSSGLNPHFLRARKVIPLDDDQGAVELAMADPSDDEAAGAIEYVLGLPVLRAVAEESDIQDALEAAFSGERVSVDDSVAAEATQLSSDLLQVSDKDSDAPVIRMVSRLIGKAISLGASDLHIEPQVDSLWVRFRVDGALSESERLSRRYADPVISRIKLMAKLDIAEKRLPQDGRIRTSVRGASIDLRLATFPTIHGESAVLRVLGQQEVSLDIDSVGLSGPGLAALKASLKQPSGLILITGPTGSGKTTTLYAALNAIKTPEVKVVTVEDPIEISLPEIAQLQVKQEIGLTFSAALRSVLRNDPDIIMVGEIRDKETADIAIRAALTGHLVLATLHTNSAAGAVTRLLDLGVDEYLVASVLLLTSAQRLVRRLCPVCSAQVGATLEQQQMVSALWEGAGANLPERLPQVVGCPACHGKGYAGRIPIFEAISLTDALKARITSNFDEMSFQAMAVRQGTRTLAQDGLEHVLGGRTSLEELLSVVGQDHA